MACGFANPWPGGSWLRRKQAPAYLDGVVQENPMHGLSDGVHSSEGERQVGKTATDFGSR